MNAKGVRAHLDELVGALPDSAGAVILSADGMVLDSSGAIDPLYASHLSAVAAGLHAVASAAARHSDAGRITQTMVEMEYRMLVVLPVTDTVLLGVVLAAVTDLAAVNAVIAGSATDLAGRRDLVGPIGAAAELSASVAARWAEARVRVGGVPDDLITTAGPIDLAEPPPVASVGPAPGAELVAAP